MALVAGSALTGCGGGGDQPSADESGDTTSSRASSGSPSRAASSPTTDVRVPDGVTLTDLGARLSFGDTARVAYEVEREGTGKKSEKRTVGTVLALTVDSATKGSLADLSGFNLTDPYQKKANYYYVRVTVRNVGERRLGDVPVPLWGISGENTLLPPVRFTSAFATCPTEALPVGFAPGSRFRTCLVFLSPDKGSLTGVSYRPTEDVTPIEWHGKVRTPERAGAGGGRDRSPSGG